MSTIEVTDENVSEKYKELMGEFEQGAYSIDPSRGSSVILIGLRGAYVIDRLNEVFGLIGYGWFFVPSTHRIIENGSKKEAVVCIAIQYRIDDGMYPVKWGGESGWSHDLDGKAIWSQPVFSTGANRLGTSGGTPFTDAVKGAETDAISKAASKLGVGIQAYQGKLEVDKNNKVVTKGESHPIDNRREMKAFIDTMLSQLSKGDPDSYDAMRGEHEQVRDHFEIKILQPLADYIKANDLGEFVADNFNAILNNENLTGFAHMTMPETAYLASVVHTIATGENFTWKDAMGVSELDGGKLSWVSSLEEWTATRESNDED